MYNQRNATMTLERGMMRTDIADRVRCTAPGHRRFFGRLVCGNTPAYGKITQRMAGSEPREGFTPQPMQLCEEHWDDYHEVGAIDGNRMPRRKFPGIGRKGGEGFG